MTAIADRSAKRRDFLGAVHESGGASGNRTNPVHIDPLGTVEFVPLVRVKWCEEVRAMPSEEWRVIPSFGEHWLPLPGYEGLYEISDHGGVRSLYFDPPRVLKTPADKDGYPIIMLSAAGSRTPKRLHRLVALAFHRDKRNALHNETAHLDNDRANCRAANLKWVSKVENHSHKRLHGTHQAGEKHPRAKLTEANVVAIRHASQPYAKLAERYGVSWHTISDIKQGRRWKSSIRIARRLQWPLR